MAVLVMIDGSCWWISASVAGPYGLVRSVNCDSGMAPWMCLRALLLACSPSCSDVAFRIGPKRFEDLGQFIGLRDERRDVAFTIDLDCYGGMHLGHCRASRHRR